MNYHIKTSNLGKTYKKLFRKSSNNALKSLTIEVPEGTIMGFLGKNGAGKTTTIKILLGLVKATQGSAEVMGLDISDKKSRNGVAHMPEVANMGMRDNTRNLLTTVGRLARMSYESIDERITEVTKQVGLEGKEEVLFGEFSKGMKQRALLAQALFTKPKLLILDEPFSGLDPIGRKEIRDLIVKYNKDYNTTVFFSSHILADVEVMCDSIGILDKGELKALGEKDELLGIESIEISGSDVDSNGVMFIEKLSDNVTKRKDKLSVFIAPTKDPEKIINLFKKYGANDIKVTKHSRNLEKIFVDIVEK